ncbi:AglZ/HisF2 family acetamidino modification protein [Chryseobacterium sp.]|uniref:AglZ/HisF2 family acetamidino modification protein n=1 Tax=Chryseobacterium sp. TaxID=1871047 RepID=UPI0012A916D5|nr:AglZ/HisF2 family acetamidino modification protein [Chryseobacterium sp.]QFG53713.1 imidazole glycerol phosphate synthase cyclase subunit [Chryseobacterium sp.]
MLRPRIIPCLLLHKNGLVKTVNFQDPTYVGDPINAVRIFSEKEVDEIAVFDIDATVKRTGPNYHLIEKLAGQSMMPLCYGGGISNADQAERVLNLGVEKVSLGNAALQNPAVITEISKRSGSQSTVVVMDVKKTASMGYEVFTHNGTNGTGVSPLEFAEIAESYGAGEVIINSIDRDGLMNGFDLELIAGVADKLSIPITVLGGAGSLEHIKEVIDSHKVIGVAAGSLFVFKGPHKAVLINYPSVQQKRIVCGQ